MNFNLLYLHIINLKIKIMDLKRIKLWIHNVTPYPLMKTQEMQALEYLWGFLCGDGNKEHNLYAVSITNYYLDPKDEVPIRRPLDNRDIHYLVAIFDNAKEAIDYAESIPLSMTDKTLPSQVIIEDRKQGEIYDRQITANVVIKYTETQYYDGKMISDILVHSEKIR